MTKLKEVGMKIVGYRTEYEELPRQPFGREKWIMLNHALGDRIPNLGRLVMASTIYEVIEKDGSVRIFEVESK